MRPSDYLILITAVAMAVTACGPNRHRSPQPDTSAADTGGTDADAGPACEGCLMGPEGECTEGVYNVACGSGGEVCKECADGEMCTSERECVSKSCAANCDGCCHDGTCQAGIKDFACGSGGERCGTCPEGEHCSAEGACIACEEGCWNDEEECLEGTADEACGTGGGQCTSCGSNETCDGGECVEPQGDTCAATCVGCCDGEDCKQGSSNAACGSDGASCQACPSGFECDGTGSCEVPPQSRWNVIAAETTIVESTVGGDLTNGPDPKLKMTIGEDYWETSVVDNKYRATWNEVVAEGVSAKRIQSDASYELIDDDTASDDIIVSDCKPGFDDEDFASGSASHTCIGGDNARARAETVFKLAPR